MTERVTIEIADHIADVRLARADKMNALDPAMFDALAAAIDRLAQERAVRCVVLSGEGRAFCAGLDLGAMATGGSGLDLDTRTHGPANLVQHVCWGWRALPMPVIAAVHGVAFGGGFQIMAGADLRLAHPATRFAIRETYWGLVPDMAGIALLRGLVRDDMARELVFTGREFDAPTAAQHGFVTRLADDPHAEALALAREIAGRNPHAIRAAKRLLNGAVDQDTAAILAAESVEQRALLRSPNQTEAVRAGMEKRAPQFED